MDFAKLISDPVGTIRDLLMGVLTGLGLAPQAATVILMVMAVVIIASFCLVLPLFLIWFERRVVARMQEAVAGAG